MFWQLLRRVADREDADFLLPSIYNLLPFSCFSKTVIQSYRNNWLLAGRNFQVFQEKLFSESSTDNTLKTQKPWDNILCFVTYSVSSYTANAVLNFNRNFQYCLASPWLPSVACTSCMLIKSSEDLHYVSPKCFHRNLQKELTGLADNIKHSYCKSVPVII